MLQARRLGAHLAARAIDPITNIFASNLQRAVKTAQAIAEAQSTADGTDAVPDVVQLPVLREKDFGSDEGVRFVKRGPPLQTQQAVASSAKAYVAPESQESMRLRIERFLAEDLMPVLSQAGEDPEAGFSIAVVAHGIILNVLLRCLLTRWGPSEFAKFADAGDAPSKKEWLASWSNTGYLEAEAWVTLPSVDAVSTPDARPDSLLASDPIAPAGTASLAESSDTVPAADAEPSPARPSSAVDIQLSVKRVNYVEHLQGLKKTRGGIGSAGFDEKQKTMDSFFSRPVKKPKLEDGNDA